MHEGKILKLKRKHSINFMLGNTPHFAMLTWYQYIALGFLDLLGFLAKKTIKSSFKRSLREKLRGYRLLIATNLSSFFANTPFN